MLSKSKITLKLIRRVSGFYRTVVTETKIEEPVKKKPRKRTTEQKRSKEITAYFDTPERRHILDSYPEAILRKKMKIPDQLYNTSESAAMTIMNHLKKDLPPDRPIFELFPGQGLLTNLIIEETPNNLILFEPETKFHKNLEVN